MESFLPSKNKQPTRLPVYCTSKVSRLQTSELPFIQPFPFLAKLCNTDVALLERLSVSGVGGGDGFHSRRGILRRYMRVENCEVKCVTGRRGGNRRDGESMSSFLVVPRNATRRGWPCSRKNKSVLARYQNFALLIIHPKMRGWSAFIILRCCILKFRDYLMEEKLDREWLVKTLIFNSVFWSAISIFLFNFIDCRKGNFHFVHFNKRKFSTIWSHAITIPVRSIVSIDR